MNRDMYEYKKFVALTESNTPTCYIPGLCRECDFVLRNSARINDCQPLKCIDDVSDFLVKK